MYHTYEEAVCERCRETTNKVERERWEKDNPYLVDSPHQGATSDEFHANPRYREEQTAFAKKKKEAGYYAWSHPLQKVVIVTADCHGDSIVLCHEHLKEWFKELESGL